MESTRLPFYRYRFPILLKVTHGLLSFKRDEHDADAPQLGLLLLFCSPCFLYHISPSCFKTVFVSKNDNLNA
ncbi:hypothetical protein BDR07DRAFT_1387364 [Suillus spraguei]|nr:hypothetical protein BDR07DRAFT_1387364 [Suillus spraguei]